MKQRLFKCLLFTAVLVTAGVSDVAAQASPKTTAEGKIGQANVKITYSSPSVKGRKIWGDLVPYGKVWRSGANEATILETDKDLVVEGKKLPAGKYSLYTVPNEKEWMIILNSKTGQWGIEQSGETTRNAENDVLTATVKPQKSATMSEKLTYIIKNGGIVLAWENLEVPISVK